MASMIEMLSKDSLRALEALGRPGVSRVQTEKHRPLPPPKAHNGRETVPQQKQIPFILDVVREAGYVCIWLGADVVGSVEAHWTEREQGIIRLAILDGAYTTRRTWYGRWGVVISC